jgi:hypothetical protein
MVFRDLWYKSLTQEVIDRNMIGGIFERKSLSQISDGGEGDTALPFVRERSAASCRLPTMKYILPHLPGLFDANSAAYRKVC